MIHPAITILKKGRYSAYATEVTYTHLFDLAQEMIKTGHGVVIDATFSRDMHRRKIMRLAAQCQVLPVFVECRAPDAVLAERLRRRETKPSLSDARLIHLDHFKQRYEPITEIEPAIHIRVDTSASPSDCLRRILLHDALWDLNC